MTPDYVIASIKLSPEAGNDECFNLFCVILLAVA